MLTYVIKFINKLFWNISSEALIQRRVNKMSYIPQKTAILRSCGFISILKNKRLNLLLRKTFVVVYRGYYNGKTMPYY